MTKQVKVKEPVRIRTKKLANGNESIYLDLYKDGDRVYEFLKLYLIPEKSKADKEANRKTLELANAIKAKRIVELQNNEHGFKTNTTRSKMNLIQFVLHLADEGFEQISVEPVVADPNEPYAIQPEDIPQICEGYDILAKEMLARKKQGKGFNFFHYMIDLSGGPCVYKRLSGCGSGTEYLAVTPWGDLYPCHQFVGEEQFCLGNVDDGVVNTDMRDTFKLCNVYAKEECRNCFAKFYCSGGCAANAYHCHGDINKPYETGCELQRKRVECAIMLKAAEAYDEEN